MNRFTFITLGLFAAFPVIMPATDFTWTGNSNSSWINPANWSGGNGNEYPNDNSDTVTLPANHNDNKPYPVFDATSAITIKSFKVLKSTTSVVLELAAHSSDRVLKIEEPDGLSPGGPGDGQAGGQVKLNRNSELWLLGGGVLAMQGDLVFNSENATSIYDVPELVLGDGTTLYIGKDSYGNVIRSLDERGGIIRGEITSPDHDETVIIHPDLKGSFMVDPVMVALGGITTDVSEADKNHTIRLLCLPKLTYQTIASVGSAANNKLGTVIIDAQTVTSMLNPTTGPNVSIGDHGVFKVNRHFVTPGAFTQFSGGKLEVKSGMFFEVNHEIDVGCTAVE